MKKLLAQHTNTLSIKSTVMCWFLGFVFSVNGFAAPSDAELIRKLNVIEKKSNTIMGITAIYIEKNKVIAHNSNQRFFMASTIKLPIAMAFLHRVDEKKDSLNRVIIYSKRKN